MPYLTYLAQSAIQQVAKDAVNEYIAEMTPDIKNQVKLKLSSGEMIDSFADAIIRSTKGHYELNIDFKETK